MNQGRPKQSVISLDRKIEKTVKLPNGSTKITNNLRSYNLRPTLNVSW